MKLSKFLLSRLLLTTFYVLSIINIPPAAGKPFNFPHFPICPAYYTVQDTTKHITFSAVDLKTKDGKKVFTFVQQPPKFPEGIPTLQEYLKANIPLLKNLLSRTGETIILNLIINEKGFTEDIQVIKPQGVELGPETTAVLEKIPRWVPGKQSGKSVPVSYTLPIRL